MYRSDVVGSLLRPAYLKDVRERHEHGALSDTEFKRAEDCAVDEAVELQKRAGVDVLTDGEMRRYAFYGHLIDAVEGFDKFGGWAIPFRNEKGEELVLPRPVVVGKLLSTEMDNAVIGDHPGITFGLHLCRGNNQSKFYAAGDYGPITRVFQKTRFHRFLLEYDDERSGGFEPLRQVPEDRAVVLGLVSSKKAALESKDELKHRIEQASEYIPLDRLALSPQCGFASTMEGNLLTTADQEAKLRLVAETAREVWGKQAVATRLRA